MKKNRYNTVRRQKEDFRRFSSLTHVLISVVALIECLVLISFTTYSWIESSSSLIISTGEGGALTMSVANNLNYQVLVSLDASGNVMLGDEEHNELVDDGGYYRSVRYFNYAKTSSPDGKTFYFKKTNNDSTNPYRLGDTADYNTSYTYMDFVLKNTTKSTKGFYFNTSNIFGYTNSKDANETYKDHILQAMRISVQQNDDDPDIYSISGHSSDAINSITGATTVISTRNITDGYTESGTTHSYVYTGGTTDSPVFESVVNNSEESVEDNISIRIWFDSTDEYYKTLTGDDKTAFDEVLSAAQISLDFSFINDNVDYDQIYFDDFAFSYLSSKLGKFTTEENGAYNMYFHAYNAKTGGYVNFPMSKVSNNDNDAVRWMASVPIPYVIEDRTVSGTTTKYLTDTSTTYYSNAYFFYGTAANNTADPTYIAYKWSLPGAMSIDTPVSQNRSSNNQYVITDDTRYFRSLGVVRGSETVYKDIQGFLQFSSDSSGGMNLIYVRDMATGLSGLSYNMENPSNSRPNFQYVTESVHDVDIQIAASGSSGTVTAVGGYFYIKYPLNSGDFNGANSAYITYYDSNGNTIGTEKRTMAWIADANDYKMFRSNETVPDGAASARVYHNNEQAGGRYARYMEITADMFSSGAASCSTSLTGSVYATSTWVPSEENPAVTALTQSLSDYPIYGGTGTGSEPDEDEYITIHSSGIYLNSSSTESDTKKTVGTYYDSSCGLFKAYVPSSWLTGGFYTHYNQLNAYYDVESDKIRWNTGVASQYDDSNYIYTLLGYTDASILSSLTAGTGVGTWDDVREMSFNTELIDAYISSDYVYKIGFDSGAGAYPMIPSDSLYFTFKTYIPDNSSLELQETDPYISYTRYGTYNSSTVTGTWTPAEEITSTETIYYAIDSTGESSYIRGWYHVAVLVDGTFENIVYDTLYGNDAADGSSLAFSYDDSTYTNIVSKSDGTITEVLPYKIDNTRWVVPVKSDSTIYDTVYFRWIPYTNTEFKYTQYIPDGIYYVVSEAS